MLKKAELRNIAAARLDDAQALYSATRYDGAVYLCGYAVEVALKARICDTLGWPEYPDTRAEFQNLLSFRTHNLDVLLKLSGVELSIKTHHLVEWSTVLRWDPEARYKPIGSATRQDAQRMMSAAQIIVGAL